MIAARVGRFYGDGYVWAVGLPLSDLARLASMMPAIAQREHVAAPLAELARLIARFLKR